MDARRAGKRTWADRRRPVTRRSGFSANASGSEHQELLVPSYLLALGDTLVIDFELPDAAEGEILGFGGYLYVDGTVQLDVEAPTDKTICMLAMAPDWGKFGSQWYRDRASGHATVEIAAIGNATVAVALLECGVVEHQYLRDARPPLMKNMHMYAPEGNFVVRPGTSAMRVEGQEVLGPEIVLHRKSCNRCGRYLPINLDDERVHLSFSNHCVAEHRLPCSHSGFSSLRGTEGAADVTLNHGYQLECRFCKKFEVNAAHNPQRTSAQMKEDGARRRAIELLLAQLFGGSSSLLYRQANEGRELVDDVWARFNGRCFRCQVALGTPKQMQLDHTRPLALLWPLDGSATALCRDHNTEKRDRAPIDYYTAEELVRLAAITGLELDVLRNPSPNLVAIERLLGRLDWFFSDFLQTPEMQEIHDGKLAADLLLKALNKVLARAGIDVDLAGLYETRP